MIRATVAGDKVIVTIQTDGKVYLERCQHDGSDTGRIAVYTSHGFVEKSIDAAADLVHRPFFDEHLVVASGDIVDTIDADGVFSYRILSVDNKSPAEKDWQYSPWIRVAKMASRRGYSFGNYEPLPDEWGEVVTPDDMRYTYLWGTDFRAANGESFTDEQIAFYINASMAALETELCFTIKKRRVRSLASERGFEQGIDYDEEEAPYDFSYARISRYGTIHTRRKPILQLHRLELLSRYAGMSARILTERTVVDKEKGILKLMERPARPPDTTRGIQQAISMYGQETLSAHLFYAVDYDAGFESAVDVPADLREVVAKHAAVSLLNVIGDGLMSGFSSSSLSLDGISESFSSTQSATSAYFGARIKEYKDDIKAYIEKNKQKYSGIPIGIL